ncbi:MAG: glycoside hydrolase family 2 protein [Flavobacteriales bacterium]
MNTRSIFFYIVLLFVSFTMHAQTNSSTVIQSTLQADWTVVKRKEWQGDKFDDLPIKAKVPGNIHDDLHRAGLIPDPLIGTNEAICQWVGEEDWIYQTAPFDCPIEVWSQEIVRLQFKQLDTYATVFLNDQKILMAENTFRAYDVDVRDIIKEKGNVLRIEFQSAVTKGHQKIKDRPYPLPGDALRAVTRKPQYHFGWDWGPKLITCGITGPIEWLAFSTARITDVYAQQDSITPESAFVTMRVSVYANEDFLGKIAVSDAEGRVIAQQEVSVKRGPNTFSLPVVVTQPRLWWCNEQGESYQYTFTTSVQKQNEIIDRKEVRTGLRTLRLVTEKDRKGETFYFELNGKPIFAKGANYIPITMLPAQATEEDYRQLLQMCKDAHFNMLRVWGGGYYENDIFYNLCDEMGIMVWQDFMFACSMYPGDQRFLTNLEEEARQQTIRLRNHPSMALWCGNNENAEGWERWGWQMGLTDAQKQHIAGEYDAVFKKLLPNMVAEQTQTSYWESSPRFGRGDARSITEGDSHYWGLWHDAEPFEILNERVPRFMSEFGMQSYPSDEVVAMMLTGDQFKITDPGIAQHQKHGRGFQLMDDYMRKWYEAPTRDSLQPYGDMTRRVQAEGMCMGIEAHRRNMPYCMGTLYWQLNDVWPSFSWSSIDYKMQPKPFFDSLKVVYAPQLLSAVVENNFLNVYYIDDVNQSTQTVNLHLTFFDQNENVLKEEESQFLTAEFGGNMLYSKRWDDLFPRIKPNAILVKMEIRTLIGETVSIRTVRLR